MLNKRIITMVIICAFLGVSTVGCVMLVPLGLGSAEDTNKLSPSSFFSGGKAHMSIDYNIVPLTAWKFWYDLELFRDQYNTKDINLFVYSIGGYSSAGLSLADQILRARKQGFRFTVTASGNISSAAVLIVAVCDVRLADPSTMFFIHKTSINDQHGQPVKPNETQKRQIAHDNDYYIRRLAQYSSLSEAKWKDLSKKETSFSAEKALNWGLVDRVFKLDPSGLSQIKKE